MSRLIDADALMEASQYEFWQDCSAITPIGEYILGKFRQLIRNMPTVTPEPQWIPCSETVDIPDHEIMACDKYGEIMFGYLAYEDDQWICESDGCEMVDPIAWCEKPEPYREEGETDVLR